MQYYTYPMYMDDRQYYSWYHETHTITSIQGTETVFDPHYRPSETSHVFMGRGLTFMFSVF